MIVLPVIAIVLGYLLGSIPSAYLIGRLWGKIDLRQEGDGHISATAVYRKVGRIAFILTLIMDAGKGVLAVYLATLLTDSSLVMIAVAYAAVIGHCWSVFIRFRGGLGALIIYAVLGTLAFREFLVGAAVALVLLLAIRKSSWSTYALLAVASLMLLVEKGDLVIAISPLGLILIQLLKGFQVRKASTVSAYRNEIFDDLKRIR